jgi:hypothetical protein
MYRNNTKDEEEKEDEKKKSPRNIYFQKLVLFLPILKLQE